MSFPMTETADSELLVLVASLLDSPAQRPISVLPADTALPTVVIMNMIGSADGHKMGFTSSFLLLGA
jgi:hypothetical protein